MNLLSLFLSFINLIKGNHIALYLTPASVCNLFEKFHLYVLTSINLSLLSNSLNNIIENSFR